MMPPVLPYQGWVRRSEGMCSGHREQGLGALTAGGEVGGELSEAGDLGPVLLPGLNDPPSRERQKGQPRPSPPPTVPAALCPE